MKRKPKWKNIITFILFMFFVLTLVISITNITKWNIDKNKTKNQIENIQKIVKVKKKKDNKNTKIIESENEKKDNPYWDYIKMNMIDVDLNELKKINNETIGWIKVNGTNINYPIVQTKDNDFYLTHSFNKRKNSAGWVFLDYRNNINDLDSNTIIYAHGRYDNTMFGTLKNILKSNWYDNINNHVIKLATKHSNTLWQVFSVYKIKTTNDYLATSFESKDVYQEFLNTLINRSAKKFNTTVTNNDKIITLSTCYNNSEKVVMHAKLIKINES